jgi:CYTH domain-containing protein
MIELERTFLARSIPDLSGCKKKQIIDIYVPPRKNHPTLRIRKDGDRMFITKKVPIEGDASRQKEHTIELVEEEFEALSKIDGKRVEKIRHFLDVNGKTAEIDIFQGPLLGLVLVDFEFETEKEKEAFQPPEFCLVDVTKELFIAGGMLCGKSYGEIEGQLNKFGYQRLFQ